MAPSSEEVKAAGVRGVLQFLPKKLNSCQSSASRGESVVTQQEWFTVDEAAEYLRVSVGYRTSKRGYWRFRKEDLDKALKKGAPEDDTEGLVALTATADPVLAEVWSNDKDAAYDRV
jgi:hypothetical protein